MRRKIGFATGLIFFIIVLLLPSPPSMSAAAKDTSAVVLLMAIWWVTEAIPIPVTALLPLFLFPILGIMGAKEVAPHYADRMVFLFMGGFMLAIAMQKWKLHRRIALYVIRFIGINPSRLILGFLVSSAFLSMWISNTSVTLMMLPIGLAVVEKLGEESARVSNSDYMEEEHFKSIIGLPLLLALAYGSSIGGMGNLFGTPPNVIFSGFVKNLFPSGPDIGFLSWMIAGFPLVVVFVPITWLLLRLTALRKSQLPPMHFPKDLLDDEINSLGKMDSAQRTVLIIFLITVVLWVFRGDIHLGFVQIRGWSHFFPYEKMIDDSMVAMLAGLVLFLLPSLVKKGEMLLNWKDVETELPWGVLLLFGGGFAIAAGIQKTQLDHWIGSRLSSLSHLPVLLVIILVIVVTSLLTEVTSNTATTSILLPLLASMATGMGENPLLLMIPATFAASCAFMLPSGTPPNAIIFGSKWVTIPQMFRIGIFVKIVGLILVLITTYLIVIPYYNIVLGTIPAWAK